MRTTEVLATVAIAGAVATFAVLNVNSVPQGTNFLANPITDAEREFINFIAQYHRTYGTKEEYQYRLDLFSKVYNDILTHDPQVHGFEKELNQFADLNDYEFKQLLGYKSNSRQEERMEVSLDDVSAPASVDWRNNGAVTGVKNQGSCGSCWAFSATGAIEGAYKVKSGSLISLSEQQFVDCSKSYGNNGCNGGLMDNAFKYAAAYKIESESDYPYTGRQGSCGYSAAKGKVQLRSHADVKANSPSSLQAAVAQQPVSVAIEADKSVFQSYKSGIITSTACGTTLDHGVLVVGYGTDAGQDYWLLKNSWGTTWGEKGFFRIARSSATGKGICGLLQEPSYPTF
jgi:cathepsin L